MKRINEYKPYILITFNFVIILYLSKYALNSIMNLYNGIKFMNSAEGNFWLLVYMFLLVTIIITFFINWYKKKRPNLYGLVVILIAINMLY